MEATSLTKTLTHDYKSIHTSSVVPELSSVKSFDFISHLNELNYEVPAPLVNGTKFCGKCNTLMIPGITMTMRILSIRKRQPEGKKQLQKTASLDAIGKMNLKSLPRQTADNPNQKPAITQEKTRVLRYTCLMCRKTNDLDTFTIIPGSAQTKAKTNDGKDFVAVWNSQLDNKAPGISQPTKDKSKKNRKKNNLSSLLDSKKKLEAQSAKKGSLLSFDDFMKH